MELINQDEFDGFINMLNNTSKTTDVIKIINDYVTLSIKRYNLNTNNNIQEPAINLIIPRESAKGTILELRGSIKGQYHNLSNEFIPFKIPNNGLVNKSLQSGKIIYEEDTSSENSIFKQGIINDSTKSELVIPVLVSGKPIGAIDFLSQETKGIPYELHNVFKDIVRYSTKAIDCGRIKITNHYDSLMKDALNRKCFFEALDLILKEAYANRNPITLVFADIDNFKSYNSQYGHMKTDNLLKELSGEIASKLRARDIFGRIGGDESCFAFNTYVTEKEHEVINKIMEAGKRIRPEITLSLGAVTIKEVNHATPSLDDLLIRCDDLASQSKKEGKNQAIIEQDYSYKIKLTY